MQVHNNNLELSKVNIFKLEALGMSLPKIDLADIENVKGLAKVELKVEHHFSLGLYARVVYMPKDATVVGKLHKYPQLNILLQGKLLVSVDDEIKELKAPFIFSSNAGVKRVAYILEDVIWITIHSTHETDLEVIEKHFLAQTEQEYLEFCGQQRLLP